MMGVVDEASGSNLTSTRGNIVLLWRSRSSTDQRDDPGVGQSNYRDHVSEDIPISNIPRLNPGRKSTSRAEYMAKEIRST